MRKYLSFLPLALIMLFVLACDFQLPKAIEVKGSPELKLNANYELSGQLSSFILETLKGEDIVILECTATPFLTYIIHMEILEPENIELPLDFEDIIDEFMEEEYFDDDEIASLFPVDLDGLYTIGELDDYLTDMLGSLEESVLDEFPNEIIVDGVPITIDRSKIFESLFGSGEPGERAPIQDALRDSISEEVEGEAEGTINIVDIVKNIVKETVIETIRAQELIIEDDLFLYDNAEEPFLLPLEGLSESLNGFGFNGLQAILYLSLVGDDGIDADIMELLEIELSLNGEEIDQDEITLQSGKSGLDDYLDGTTYPNMALPNPNGGVINLANIIETLLNAEGDVEVLFNVFIPKDTTIGLSVLRDYTVSAEIVIWLPLSLKAHETDGAEFVIKDLFGDGDSDMFNRNGPGDANNLTDIISKLKLSINLNSALATGMSIVITNPAGDPNFEIVYPINGTLIQIELNETYITAINQSNNFPFIPDLTIRFSPNSTVQIPRNLSLVSVAAEVSFNYRIDL